MAITVQTRNPMQVIGDRRMATFEILFSTAGNGNFDTGLSRILWADVQPIDDSGDVTNADAEVLIFRNNNTTTDNGTVNGTLHITGADVKSDTTDGYYMVRVIGY